MHLKSIVNSIITATLATLVPLTLVNADSLPDFYDVAVPVESTDASDLSRAASLALQNMLIRASGTEAVLQNQRLQQAFAKANTYISQYGYQRVDDGGLVAAFNFNASLIDRLLNQAGEPVWTPDRPSTLVWMVVEEKGETRVAVKGDPVFDALLTAAKNRGLVLKAPLYDLEDRFNLSAEQLWQQQSDVVLSASERYPSNVVMMARAWQDSRQAWHINWDMLKTQGLNAGSESCLRLDDCFNVPVAELAERWSAKYSVVAKYSQTDSLKMVINGLDFQAYSRLLAYLKGLPAMQNVLLYSIDKGQYNFDLAWRAERETLIDLLALNDNLQQVTALEGDALAYQWIN